MMFSEFMKLPFLFIPVFSFGLMFEHEVNEYMAAPMFSCVAATPTQDKALLSAIQSGKEAEVKKLISEGANVNSIDEVGWPLLYAAIPCKTEILELLIKAGAKVNSSSTSGDTVLSRACWQLNDPKAIELLLKSGADVKANDNSALFSAVEAGKLDFVKLLIKAGADVNAKNKKGKGVLQFCSNSQLRDFLIKSVTKVSAADLQATAFSGGVNGVRALIAIGADVNQKDDNGCTALILLVKNGWNSNATAKGIDGLIQAGADINIKDNSGKSALDYAVDKAQDKKIKALCKTPALISQALDYAVAKGNKKAESIIRSIPAHN